MKLQIQHVGKRRRVTGEDGGTGAQEEFHNNAFFSILSTPYALHSHTMFGASSSGQTSKGLAAARAHQHKASNMSAYSPPFLPPVPPINTTFSTAILHVLRCPCACDAKQFFSHCIFYVMLWTADLMCLSILR